MARKAKEKDTKATEEKQYDPRTLKLGHKVEGEIVREDEDNIALEYPSKSEAIRRLHTDHNLSRSEISKALGIRYQMVYNVLDRAGLLESESETKS